MGKRIKAQLLRSRRLSLKVIMVTFFKIVFIHVCVSFGIIIIKFIIHGSYDYDYDFYYHSIIENIRMKNYDN